MPFHFTDFHSVKFGQLHRHPLHIRSLVSLAAERDRSQVRRVGLEHQPAERNPGQGFGQSAFLERHHPVDSDEEVLESEQFLRLVGRTGEAMENTLQLRVTIRAQHLEKLGEGYFVKVPNRTIELKDDLPYLEYFAQKKSIGQFMKNETIWGEDLTQYAGFYDAVMAHVEKIKKGESLW